MENIDKIKCVLIDFENNDKTLDETAKEILLLFSVVGRSKQLFCDNHRADLEHFLNYSESFCKNCNHKV